METKKKKTQEKIIYFEVPVRVPCKVVNSNLIIPKKILLDLKEK